MKNHLFLYALLILTVLLMVGCTPGIPQLPINNNLQGNESDQGNNQDESTSVPRVVFIELFNTEYCAASKAINPIIEEIVAEYENTEVILVEMAGWGKHATDETHERFKWYFSDKSKLHTPSVCFDGLNQLFAEGFVLGGDGNSGNSGNEDVGDAGVNEDPEIVEVDITKPVITGSRDPLPNSFGWNNTDVIVSFSCVDTNPVKSAFKINTVKGKTLTKEGKGQSVTNTGVLIDAAGNIADPITVSDINIDKTPPVVTITLPGTGEYVLNQSITATWSATDALSGVVAPVSGTVSIDTSSVGTKTLTLPEGTAKDKAGNSSLEVTKSYSVIEDTEEPVIVDPGDPDTVYPQQWATGTGTVGDPWANDCIKKAYTACPVGGTIFLKAGYYQLAGQLTLSKKINIIGEGMDKAFILTANANGIYLDVNSSYSSLKDFTIDGDSQTNGTGSNVVVKYANYLLMENIKVMNSGYYGMSLIGSHNTYKNIWAVDCYRHGIHPGGSTASANSYNLYKDIYITGTEESNAFDDNGNEDSSYNTYDHIVCWNNKAKGIAIHGQEGGSLINSSSYDNTNSYGIDISHITGYFTVSDCLIYNNNSIGIYLNDCENVNLSNVISKNNTGSGIFIEDSIFTKLSLCQSYDDRDTPIQDYGLRTYGTTDDMEIISCKLTPNAVDAIRNDAIAVITITDTEKMLARLYQP